jgi:type II secretory pathway pseudopilin PulG
MAALLIGMSVAAVLMTAVMPAWKQMTRREREAELIFRGQQYVRAIGLFQKRSGPGVLPPNLDVLVTGRFLRKKFKDPITNQDFDLLSPTNAAGTATPGQVPGQTQPGTSPSAQAGRGGFQTSGTVVGAPPGAAPTTQSGGRGGATGGIMGVVSKSKEASIRLYNGRTHYNEWQFVFVQQAQAAGQGGVPGQPGGVPGQPGGVGRGGSPQRGGPPPFGPGGQGTGRQGTGRGPGNTSPFPQGGRASQPPPTGTPSTSPFQPRR